MKLIEIERLLPGVFQRAMQAGTPLVALLEVMEALHAPDEAILDQLAAYFNAYQMPDRMVPFLAGWVDLDWLLQEAPEELGSVHPGGLGRLRELIAAATFLAQWRGTGKGLLRFLETATGVSGFAIEEQVAGDNGLHRPFHMRIQAPREAEHYRIMIESIIESEKPAYVTYELQFMEPAVGDKQPLVESKKGTRQL